MLTSGLSQYLAAAHWAVLSVCRRRAAVPPLLSCPVWRPCQPPAELFSQLSTLLYSWPACLAGQDFRRQAQEPEQAPLRELRETPTDRGVRMAINNSNRPQLERNISLTTFLCCGLCRGLGGWRSRTSRLLFFLAFL